MQLEIQNLTKFELTFLNVVLSLHNFCLHSDFSCFISTAFISLLFLVCELFMQQQYKFLLFNLLLHGIHS